MKKIYILMIVIALLAITLPVMGQVTFSGEIKSGIYASQEKVTIEGESVTRGAAAAIGNTAKLSAAFVADENVSGAIDIQLNNDVSVDLTKPEFGGAPAGTPVAVLGSQYAKLDKAAVNLNLLGALGVKDVPMVMTLTGGFVDTNKSGVVSISHHELEKVLDVPLPKTFGTTVLDTKIMDLVTVRTAVAPQYQAGLIKFLVGAFGTVGPISAEVFYGNGKNANGDIATGVAYSGVFGDVTVKAGANLQVGITNPDATLTYGAAASVAYTTLVKATVGMKGSVVGSNSDNAFTGVGIGIESTPVSLLTLKAGTVIDGRKGAVTAFDGLELLAQLNLGKSSLGLGYNYLPKDANNLKNDAFVWKAATPDTIGGVSFQYKTNF